MPDDLTRESERILEQSRALVRDNQAGGRFRRMPPSIGRGSAEMKRQHLAKKLRNIAFAAGAIFAFSIVAGLIIDGIGFTGIVMTFFALIAAGIFFGKFPRMKVPRREDLMRGGDVQTLVGRTELWLEHQRPALPAPAADMVGKIGVQLDALGLQLEGLDQQHPTALEIRRLVGEHLPEMVDSYRRIPAHLRSEQRAGSSADEQLTQSLGKISDEIDSVTRHLAEGSLDNLAIKNRYLEYRYGGADEPVSEKN
jgi:hypothetical protein